MRTGWFRAARITGSSLSGHNLKGGRCPLWVGRVCLLVAAVAIVVAVYHFYHPKNMLLTRSLDPRMDQTLFFGIPLLVIVTGAWLWPIDGGVIAILHGTIRLLSTSMWIVRYPMVLVPWWLYVLCYVTFVAGGALSVVGGRRQTRPSVGEWSHADKLLRRAASIMSFGAVGVSVVLLTVIYRNYFLWALYVGIPAAFFAYVAWVWPPAGGMLMMLFCFRQFPVLIRSPDDIRLAGYILWAMFLAGGLLHLFVAWRRKIYTGGNVT